MVFSKLNMFNAKRRKKMMKKKEKEGDEIKLLGVSYSFDNYSSVNWSYCWSHMKVSSQLTRPVSLIFQILAYIF